MALQANRGRAIGLRFPSVFSEDETMWIVIVGPLGWQRMGDGLRFPSVFSEDGTMWIAIIGPLGWQRMGDGSSLPLCIQ